MKVSKEQHDKIINLVERLFGRLKARFAGRLFRGPAIFFEIVQAEESLEDAYRHAGQVMYGPAFTPDEDTVQQVIDVASHYVDAEKHRTINRILAGVRAAQSEAEVKKVIKDAVGKATTYVSLLAVNETRTAQAHAERDGISLVAAGMGVDDPNVAFLGRYDSKTCKYCRAMYHREDNPAVPRVYKLSQVNEGYFKPKEWDGTTPWRAPLHPHCRHIMTFVPPNFGFDKSGKITFVSYGYDAYDAQPDVEKMEFTQLLGEVLHKEQCACG